MMHSERNNIGGGRRTRAGAWVFALAATATLLVSPLAASAAPSRPSAVPSGFVTASRAITLLNEQREHNGIPGDLTNDVQLSEGCSEFMNDYVPAPGQFPHEELTTQPGYTPLGAQAAASSDLGPFTSRPSWGANRNPWWDLSLPAGDEVSTTGGIAPDSIDVAPLHLTLLFDPAATTAWFGETDRPGASGGDCMGTGDASQFSTPTFFSFPGNDTKDIPAYEVASEAPWTPQMVLGIPQDKPTGPNFILWAEGTDAVASAATLTDQAGKSFPVRLVLPSMPSPANGDAQWASYTMVGELSGGASFAIPTRPLLPNTIFSLAISWTSPTTGETSTQTIGFTTGPQAMVGQTLPLNIRVQSPQIVIKQSTATLEHEVTLTVKSCQPIGAANYRCGYGPALYSRNLFPDSTASATLVPQLAAYVAKFGEVLIQASTPGYLVGDTRYLGFEAFACYPKPEEC